MLEEIKKEIITKYLAEIRAGRHRGHFVYKPSVGLMYKKPVQEMMKCLLATLNLEDDDLLATVVPIITFNKRHGVAMVVRDFRIKRH